MVRFLGLVAFLFATATAEAGFEVRFFVNDPTMINPPTLDIVDGGGNDVFAGTPGLIGYNGPIGALVSTQFSISLSNSPGGTIGIITTSASEIRNLTNAATNLTIFVSGNDFTAPASPPALEVDGTMSGTLKGSSTGIVNGIEQFAAGTVAAQFTNFTDSSNALFGTGFSSATFTGSAAGISKSFGGPLADSTTPGFNTAGPYSISNLTQLAMGPNDVIVGFNASTDTLSPVPGPGALALAFAGLLSIGLRRLVA
jgi:hypothetical protein